MTQRVVNYTYGTGNPVLPNGSIDVRDGIDNLQSMDVFMNAPEDAYNQRDGEIVRTVAGMNNEFDSHILNMGFTRIGTFASGATLTNPRQTLLWDIADGGDGQEYGWSGPFLKFVPPDSTPASTGGIAVGAWVSRFDPALKVQVRETQRRIYAGAGFNLVGGSFEVGCTLESANDVALDETTGKAYSGVGPFPQIVDPDTNPIGPLFVDKSNGPQLMQSTGTVAGLRNLLGVSGSSAACAETGSYYFWKSTTQADNGIDVVRPPAPFNGPEAWVRHGNARIIHASDVGIVGNANYRDKANGRFCVDEALTIEAHDDTAAMQAVFAVLNASNSFDNTAKVFDLDGKNVYVNSQLQITKSYVTLKNGRIKQKTNELDALQFAPAGAAILMYCGLDKVSFHKCHSNINSGSLVHVLQGGVGQFIWNSQGDINEGGFNGFRMYGDSFMMNLDYVWTNDTYSSGFYMPGAGGTTQPPVQLGGSTTTVMTRPYVTNVATSDPAFDVGTGYDGVTMIMPAADHITTFGRFKVNGLNIVGIAYSENVRKPVAGPALVSHVFIDLQNSVGYNIDGIYASVASDFGVVPSGFRAFIKAEFTLGKIGQMRGTFPAKYPTIYSDGAIIDFFGERIAGPNIIVNGGIIRDVDYYKKGAEGVYTLPSTPGGQVLLHLFDNYNVAGISGAYFLNAGYSFGGNLLSATWLISVGQSKSVITLIQDGPDFAGVITASVRSDGGLILTTTGVANLSGEWFLTKIN